MSVLEMPVSGGSYTPPFHLFEPVSILTREEIAKLTYPCVYVFMQDREVRYVGVAKSGIIRFGHSGHQARDAAEADAILVFRFKDYETAKQAEAITIWWFMPPLNKSMPIHFTEPPLPLTDNAELDTWLLQTKPMGELRRSEKKSKRKQIQTQKVISEKWGDGFWLETSPSTGREAVESRWAQNSKAVPATA